MDSRKLVEVFLPVLVSFFLLSHFVFAEGEPAPIIEIDVQGIIDSVNGMFSGLSQAIAGLAFM